MIKIYNSLTRKKEDFEPLNPPNVNIYTCGVTVYDECHIGHARSLYIFNVIRGYLKYRGFNVNFVRNITDIDDKIINRANELNVGWKELVDKYIAGYNRDMESLGVSKGIVDKEGEEPRATKNIPDMVEYIEGLIEKGYAYAVDTNVYFSVRKFQDYGKLSGQSIDQMYEGVRIDPDGKKKDPLDFALWKKSKENEPSWDSPWGRGRPGWHIECSVMSRKFLNTDTLDIHAGGRDLIFPHHENEIAQAQALSGKPFAKYWLHHGLLTINGQKMSKSLGNFVTIKDFITRYNYPNILKLFFLSARYSQPVDYNEKNIQEAKSEFERILNLSREIDARLKERQTKSASSNTKIKNLEEIKNTFIEAMDDDFNMPRGLAAIFDLVNITNKNIDDLNFVSEANNLLSELRDIFGLGLGAHHKIAIEDKISATETISIVKMPSDTEILEILEEVKKRDDARTGGDYKRADQIRKELEEKGIILEDTKKGTRWHRKL